MVKTSSPSSAFTSSALQKSLTVDPPGKPDDCCTPPLRLAGSLFSSGELVFTPSFASLSSIVVDRSSPGEQNIKHIPISGLDCSGLKVFPPWAWPTKMVESTSITQSPPIPKLIINYLSAGSPLVSRISGGFTGIPFVRIVLYFACVKLLQVDSPISVLFRSSSSLEEKVLSSYPFSMERGVSSDSLPSVCFSFFISLYSYVAVSSGPEDAIEFASVFFVDEIWTLMSLFVTILLLSDFVVKAPRRI